MVERVTALLVGAVLLGCIEVWAENAYVWVEGEAPASLDIRKASEFEPRGEEEASVLSDGEWLCIQGEGPPSASTVTYEFHVLRDGTYRLVMRKFWKHGRFRWRVGDNPWKEYDREGPLLDSVTIRPKLGANWVPLGEVDLEEGPQELKIETTGQGPVCIDCFVLTRKPFLARGKCRPDEPWGEPEPGKWVFDPSPDVFSPEALLDLRHLNEETAGERGFVRRDRSGNGFADGRGRPLRFWCMTGGGDVDPERHARFLAKRGVNLIQILGGYIGNGCYRSEPGDLYDINKGYQERIWRVVAANRKHGVYTTFSCLGALGYGSYFPDTWELSPDGSKWAVRGAWFWDPRLRRAYKEWLRKFFTAVNPYTGMPLAEDPSIAFVQLMAEDGMFFWTSTKVKGAQRRMLERIYGDWLKERYGSLEQALAAWQGCTRKDDAPDEGRMGLYDMWDLAQDPEDRKQQRERLADQTEFFAKKQRSFYDEMRRFCREELGMKHLFMSGVWRTANDERMLDLERWTYAGVDVAGKSHFFDSPHQCPPGGNDTTGYQINAGDFVKPRSAFADPVSVPFMQKRAVGQPFMNHQCLWNPASPWLSESVLVMSAWSALTGLDVTGWFAHSTVEFGGALRRWGAGSPDVLGGFPGAALAFRRGDVREGRPAVIERRTFAELRERPLALITEGTGFDPNQDRFAETGDRSGGRIDPLAYLTGPIQVEFTEEEAESTVDPALNELIDRKRGIVRSNTGELTWNIGRGYGLVNTPCFKAVSGFLNKAGGEFDCGEVRIQSQDEYATIMVVSLDGRPLEESVRILVQVTTTARPSAWETRPTGFTYRRNRKETELEGYEIVSTGEAPWQIARSHVSLTLSNLQVSRARQLDSNGMAIQDVPLRRDGRAVHVKLPGDTLYLVLDEEG